MSLHLFTIIIKYLKSHYKYRIAHLVYANLISGTEFKKGKLHIKMPRNFSKKLGKDNTTKVCLDKTASCATIIVWLFSGACMWYGDSAKCVSSVFPDFLSGCEQRYWKYVLDFSEFLHVDRSFLNQLDCRTFQTLILKKLFSSIKNLANHYCVTIHS